MDFDNYSKLATLTLHGLPSPGTPTQKHQLIEFFEELFNTVEMLEDALLSSDEVL